MTDTLLASLAQMSPNPETSPSAALLRQRAQEASFLNQPAARGNTYASGISQSLGRIGDSLASGLNLEGSQRQLNEQADLVERNTADAVGQLYRLANSNQYSSENAASLVEKVLAEGNVDANAVNNAFMQSGASNMNYRRIQGEMANMDASNAASAFAASDTFTTDATLDPTDFVTSLKKGLDTYTDKNGNSLSPLAYQKAYDKSMADYIELKGITDEDEINDLTIKAKEAQIEKYQADTRKIKVETKLAQSPEAEPKGLYTDKQFGEYADSVTEQETFLGNIDQALDTLDTAITNDQNRLVDSTVSSLEGTLNLMGVTFDQEESQALYGASEAERLGIVLNKLAETTPASDSDRKAIEDSIKGGNYKAAFNRIVAIRNQEYRKLDNTLKQGKKFKVGNEFSSTEVPSAWKSKVKPSEKKLARTAYEKELGITLDEVPQNQAGTTFATDSGTVQPEVTNWADL